MNIYVEQWNFFLVLDFDDLRLSRPIHVAVHIGPLDELVFLDHLFKLFFRHEIIVDSIDFALSRSSCSERDTKPEFVWIFRSEAVDQSALAST